MFSLETFDLFPRLVLRTSVGRLLSLCPTTRSVGRSSRARLVGRFVFFLFFFFRFSPLSPSLSLSFFFYRRRRRSLFLGTDAIPFKFAIFDRYIVHDAPAATLEDRLNRVIFLAIFDHCPRTNSFHVVC